MRPTIPLADWRIATDLVATRALPDAIPLPQCRRTCEWCRNWAVAHSTILPASLITELRRLGIDPAAPTDLYAFAEPTDGYRQIPHRVTFHTTGEILSGPAAWTEDARLGRVRSYAPVPAVPGRFGLSVAYERDVGGDLAWQRMIGASLVQVDFRLEVPWLLDEPRPAVFSDGSPPRAV